jgi:hypothetical protein
MQTDHRERLVDPVACTPAAGWEKGQVENQVGVVRQRLFIPRLRFASYAELNAWLLERCIQEARRRPHPELAEQTVFEVFEAERAALVPYAGPFDSYRATVAAVSKTCLVRFDHNRYSVPSGVVGRPVEIYAYAEQIVIRQDGQVVARHERRFGRIQTIYDPWRRPARVSWRRPARVSWRRPQSIRNSPKEMTAPARAACDGCASNLSSGARGTPGADNSRDYGERRYSAVISDQLARASNAMPRHRAGKNTSP